MNIAGSDSEDAAAGETPNIVQIAIPAVDCDVTVPVTRDILADSVFDLESFIAEQASTTFGNGELDAFTNGGGSGTRVIKGLFDAEAADDATDPAFGTVGYIASGNAAGIVSADAISDLMAALPGQYTPGAVFMGNRKTISALRKIKKGTDNGYSMWQPSLQAGVPDTIDRWPVYVNDRAPAIAAGSVPLLFGNIKAAYTVVDRQQMFLLVTVSKNSKRVIDYTWFHRIGGAITDSRAIKYLKIAAE
jgi:HK97 family phage major capsid protein